MVTTRSGVKSGKAEPNEAKNGETSASGNTRNRARSAVAAKSSQTSTRKRAKSTAPTSQKRQRVASNDPDVSPDLQQRQTRSMTRGVSSNSQGSSSISNARSAQTSEQSASFAQQSNARKSRSKSILPNTIAATRAAKKGKTAESNAGILSRRGSVVGTQIGDDSGAGCSTNVVTITGQGNDGAHRGRRSQSRSTTRADRAPSTSTTRAGRASELASVESAPPVAESNDMRSTRSRSTSFFPVNVSSTSVASLRSSRQRSSTPGPQADTRGGQTKSRKSMKVPPIDLPTPDVSPRKTRSRSKSVAQKSPEASTVDEISGRQTRSRSKSFVQSQNVPKSTGKAAEDVRRLELLQKKMIPPDVEQHDDDSRRVTRSRSKSLVSNNVLSTPKPAPFRNYGKSNVLVLAVKYHKLEIIEKKKAIEEKLEIFQEFSKAEAEQIGIVVEQEEEDTRVYWDCPCCRLQYKLICGKHPHFICKEAAAGVGKNGAGRGLFANIDLPIGFVFGPYVGVRSSQDPTSGYSWLIEGEHGEADTYVDAQDENSSNYLRFANGAKSAKAENVTAVQYQNHIFYMVCHPIPANGELFCFYSEQFGRFRKTPLNRAPLQPHRSSSRRTNHRENQLEQDEEYDDDFDAREPSTSTNQGQRPNRR
ncbi:unnamed protein product [Caenorhabditis angaria]|uniref:SET domain-containing protein n=1 Tax=Caenorhabditis angaria TaxID=860376 RepID=A0A9P1J676_9PELO|nr:unnamed protein product [Caenorhabditis angaria]